MTYSSLTRTAPEKRSFSLSIFHYPFSTLQKHSKTILAALLIPTIILLFPFTAPSDRLTVVTSTFPLYEFTRVVAGDEADVWLLLPAGAEPHTWEPRPSDIARISEADLFIYLSGDMEPWAESVIRSTGKDGPRAVQVLEGLAGVPGAEAGRQGDPHLWLDLSYASLMVDYIAGNMSEALPGRAPVFRENAGRYAGEIGALHDRFTGELTGCPKRHFIVGGHAAFGSLARRYGLEQVSLYGISPDSEPSPRRMAAVIDTMRKLDLKVVYFEELVSPRLARVIADETGAETVVLHPAGNLTARQWTAGTTFLSLMEENLENLKKGLQCD